MGDRADDNMADVAQALGLLIDPSGTLNNVVVVIGAVILQAVTIVAILGALRDVWSAGRDFKSRLRAFVDRALDENDMLGVFVVLLIIPGIMGICLFVPFKLIAFAVVPPPIVIIIVKALYGFAIKNGAETRLE